MKLSARLALVHRTFVTPGQVEPQSLVIRETRSDVIPLGVRTGQGPAIEPGTRVS